MGVRFRKEKAAAISPIGGWCAQGWEPVRDAFARNFAEEGEVGAALNVIHKGDVVVDLHHGWADEAHTKEWDPNTLVNFYSVGKGLLSTLVLKLIDEGKLSLSQPIADVWPEFAQSGKATATIEHVLTHRTGVPAIREVLTNEDLFDWAKMTSAIAESKPWSRPGSRFAYHSNTFGHIAGEIVHRVTNKMPGDYLHEVALDLEADVWFGVPETQQHRCADVIWAPSEPIPALDSFDGLEGDVLLNAMAQLNPPGYSSIGLVNTSQWRSLPLGSTSGHGSARGVAKFYAGLLEPGRVVSAPLLQQAGHPQITAVCPILGEQTTFGLGFQPTTKRRPLGPNPNSFGHFGSGGALGFADPDAGIAFGYVMNHVVPRWQSTRNRALIDATYASLR